MFQLRSDGWWSNLNCRGDEGTLSVSATEYEALADPHSRPLQPLSRCQQSPSKNQHPQTPRLTGTRPGRRRLHLSSPHVYVPLVTCTVLHFTIDFDDTKVIKVSLFSCWSLQLLLSITNGLITVSKATTVVFCYQYLSFNRLVGSFSSRNVS